MKTHLLLLMVSCLAAAGAGIVSGPVRPGISAAGNSFNPTFSADGRHLVFVSQANNLVANDDRGLALDVFVRDLVTSNTALVSVSATGFGGANDSANYPGISSNGQFVAFASRADNLVSGDLNDASDIFVRDLVAGTTRLVSVDAEGVAFAGGSEFPLISANGRWVFFESSVASPTNATLNAVRVYVRDTWSNATLLVSADLAGGSNGESHVAAITPDGRFVAFTSTASNMIDGQTNSGTALYLRDMTTGSIVWATTNCVACDSPVLSDSGQVIAYFSKGVTGTGQPVDSDEASVLRHDRITGETVPVGIATRLASPILMSSDGNVMAYNHESSDAPGGSVVYVWTAATGTNALPGSTASALSHDGNFLVVFGNGHLGRIHLTNVNAGELVTRRFDDDASAGGFELSAVALSPSGRLVAFDANADDLVPSDFNAASDIFVRDMDEDVTTLITKEVLAAGTPPAHSTLGLNSISANGRYVVTVRLDDATAEGDTNTWPDVYVTDLWSNRVTAVSLDASLTNSFAAPILSADGSTIYAVRNSSSPTRARIVGATAVNEVFESTGLSAAIFAFWGGDVNGPIYAPSTSADGQLLAFTSTATDLVEGLSDVSNTDVFLRERVVSTNGAVAPTNHVISVPLSGVMGSGTSSNGLLSSDGRWVIFESTSRGLVPENVGGSPALYARDWRSNVTYLVSVAPNGNPQWGYLPGSAAVSGNSRYVAFSSGNHYLTVHDLLTRTSVIAADPSARSPSLSHDGRYVAYVQRPTLSNHDQIYMRDLQSAEPSPASAAYGSGEGNGPSSSPAVSADGRYVVFQSRASNLVANDTNSFTDIFVRDRVLGTTLLVSANAQGLAGNGPSTRPVMAADGRTVIFQSFANDLAPSDFNDRSDVFVLRLGGVDTEPDGMDDDWEVTYFGNLLRDGTGDFDGDGSSDRNEFLAGTDPSNTSSVFRVLTVAPAGGATTRVLWVGSPTQRYRVEYKDDVAAFGWIEVNGNVSWNGNVGSITDAAAPAIGHRFYRVVRVP